MGSLADVPYLDTDWALSCSSDKVKQVSSPAATVEEAPNTLQVLQHSPIITLLPLALPPAIPQPSLSVTPVHFKPNFKA